MTLRDALSHNGGQAAINNSLDTSTIRIIGRSSLQSGWQVTGYAVETIDKQTGNAIVRYPTQPDGALIEDIEQYLSRDINIEPTHLLDPDAWE